MSFLPRHHSSSPLCGNETRWWTEWHEFKRDAKGIPIYGTRILIPSNRNINHIKYLLCSDSIPSDFYVHDQISLLLDYIGNIC